MNIRIIYTQKKDILGYSGGKIFQIEQVEVKVW